VYRAFVIGLSHINAVPSVAQSGTEVKGLVTGIAEFILVFPVVVHEKGIKGGTLVAG
jgi:hypothetical protein